MDDEDIIAALESSAPVRGDHGRIGDGRTATANDIAVHRRMLLRFFEELDGHITVDEIRRSLEDYKN